MTRAILRTLKTLLPVCAVVACIATAIPVAAQEIEADLPPEVVATMTPVYFEGHAAYWYGNRWHYRDGGHWRRYREEPVFLRDSRVRREPARRFYEGRGRWRR